MKNEIILEINIRENNSKERIINSFENTERENPYWDRNIIEIKKNEDEIKECEIYINKKKIDFTYYYTLKKRKIYN